MTKESTARKSSGDFVVTSNCDHFVYLRNIVFVLIVVIFHRKTFKFKKRERIFPKAATAVASPKAAKKSSSTEAVTSTTMYAYYYTVVNLQSQCNTDVVLIGLSNGHL